MSRRGFLRISLGAAVAAAGPYGIIERLATKRERVVDARVSPTRLPREQYLFSGTGTIVDNGVVVEVAPLHREVVTATVQTDGTATGLKHAQAKLEGILKNLENEKLLTFTPSGLGIAVGWGLSYFDLPAISAKAKAKLPIDNIASRVAGTSQSVLLPSKQFATDPPDVILESNDVVFVMASDSLQNIETAYSALFEGGAADLFQVTSRRKGFVDASQLGTSGMSLTKQFALATALPGAGYIPDQSPLFLGFTSSQKQALGQGVIANLESLGMTNQTSTSYFAHGTTLALSHLYEDLESWYSNNSYQNRVALTFRPGIAQSTEPGTLTIPESQSDAQTSLEISQDMTTYDLVGHAGSMQPVSRLGTPKHGFKVGTPIPVRADFNTVDNPFFFSSDPAGDNWSATPAAGMHFLSYVPSSFYFELLRQAMDGYVRSGPPQSAYSKFVQSAGITTTHRQNFLVPPRKHRSFPLAELL
jgi:hypothetical protein